MKIYCTECHVVDHTFCVSRELMMGDKEIVINLKIKLEISYIRISYVNGRHSQFTVLPSLSSEFYYVSQISRSPLNISTLS